ncbi:MAG: DEAD/DEAH box helicase, partial [Mucilaginibacter sp.]
MLRVDSTKPCQIIYAIAKHEYLSYVIEPHIVQLNPNGEFSLTHQRLFSNTAKEFAHCIDDIDIKLIKILEEMEQGNLIKKFYKKPIRPFEFFTKIFNEQLFDTLRPKIEKRMAEALALLKDKPLYQMSKEGYPAERKVQIATEVATVLFHFRRGDDEIRYFPTIKYQGLRIEFMFKNAEVICNHPAWMLLDDTLYHFEKEIEGKKLVPFLNKRYIAIPKSSEQSYFEKFVAPLIEKHHVYAEGFTINTEKYDARPVIKPIYVEGGTSQLQLYFKYAGYVFPYGDERLISVRMERNGDEYTFHRIKRSVTWEKNKFNHLESLGLKTASSLFKNLEVDNNDEDADQSFSVFEWINQHYDELVKEGFEIEQPDSGSQKRYVFGTSKIDLTVKENNDWFDIEAMVYFGSYAIPFIQLKNHILNRKKEFLLPSGEIAIIPEKWFSQYGNLLHFSDGSTDIKLRRHHIGLVNELAEGEMASVTMTRKLQKLLDFEELEDIYLPQNFEGNLRPYQKAGYNWFHFLKSYHFGGCLADDMGLGKTIQTLALLQKHKEDTEATGGKATSLVIMPTSLIYNWLTEAKKFTPQLRLMVHTGTFRY